MRGRSAGPLKLMGEQQQRAAETWRSGAEHCPRVRLRLVRCAAGLPLSSLTHQRESYDQPQHAGLTYHSEQMTSCPDRHRLWYVSFYPWQNGTLHHMLISKGFSFGSSPPTFFLNSFSLLKVCTRRMRLQKDKIRLKKIKSRSFFPYSSFQPFTKIYTISLNTQSACWESGMSS